MSVELAILTGQLGTVSETFIRRHIEGIAPGRSIAVANRSSHPLGGRWKASCPTLFLDEVLLPVRLIRRLGIAPNRFQDLMLARFLRNHRPTVALLEYLDEFIDSVPILEKLGIPYVVQAHGIDVSAALRRSGMAARCLGYRSARAILTRCNFHRRRLIDLGLPAERIHVNPGGVDIPDQVPPRDSAAAKRFVAIGRMVPKKGPIYLLESFRLAMQNDAAITLDYVGAGGEFLTAAHQFVDAAGLGGRIRLHGMAPDALKDELLVSCGTLVQHSITDPDTGDEEGLPACIQEAMAAGMAVVSTRHSGIPEAVRDGVTGLLVEERDCGAMAAALLRLAVTPELAKAYGAAGREIAAAEYSWDSERARLRRHLFDPETPVRSYS